MAAQIDLVNKHDRGLEGIWNGVVNWYFYNFLTHFALYLPLPLTILVCVALLTNLLGEGYGVDKLVWHDEPDKQFFVGMSIALLAAEVFFVGYLLWLRDLRKGYIDTP